MSIARSRGSLRPEAIVIGGLSMPEELLVLVEDVDDVLEVDEPVLDGGVLDEVVADEVVLDGAPPAPPLALVEDVEVPPTPAPLNVYSGNETAHAPRTSATRP